jgi:phage-related baseplate assembly protein
MPTPTIIFEDLITPVTEPEIEASIFKVFGIVGLDTSSWKGGAVVRTITSAFSILLASFSQLQALIARAGYLDLSDGDWLTVVAFYVYGVERYAATFATGTVTISNEAGGVYEFDPEDLIFSNPVTGKTYRNTEHVSIPSGSTAAPAHVFNVPIRAVESGAESTSQIETITNMVTTVTGVSVKNPIAVVGQDAESDAALRARASARLGSLSPAGPWDAYTYAVRSATRPAPDGSNLGITRTRITKDGYGNVSVYMATPSGGVQPEDVAIAQEAIELNAEPICVNATAISATPVNPAVTYELWMYNTSGHTDAQIQERIKAELTAWLSLQPIGGNLIDGDPTGRIYRDKIAAVIGDTLPEIYHVALTAPASDLILTPSQVALLGPTTGTIHQSSPPVGFGV